MKNHYHKLLMVWCAFMVSATLFAQERIVSGVLTDESGESLTGVTILEKGTTNGSISDATGAYRLRLTGENPVLIFSFVGYATQEEVVGQRTVIDIRMLEDVQQLQELVVIGYGTQKKVNVSGAVDQVDAKQLENRPISSLAQGLQGTIPNLNIDYFSGEPGAVANINIRGITSINGGNPLILIDGIPSDPVELNRLVPQEIESISVIKDASAAAIYGARAAFGVILITTKSGSRGISVSYSNNFSWDRPTVLPNKITDPYIYLRLRETSTDNTPWDNQNYSDQTYQWAKERSDDPSIPGVRINPSDNTQWEYMGGRDWTDYFMEDFSLSQNHQVAVSGAGEKASYLLSASYNRQNGALKLADDYFDRYTMRNKVSYKVTPWLTLGNNTYLTVTERKLPSQFTILREDASPRFDIWSIYNLHPTGWDLNPDGSWSNTDVGRVGAMLTEGGETTDKFNSIQSQFTGEFSFFEKSLKLNTDFTYRRGNYDLDQFSTMYRIGFGPGDVREEGINAALRRSTIENYTVFNIYATYIKEFGIHQINGTVGYNQEHFRRDRFTAAREGLISASLPTIALATGDAQVGENVAEWALRGVFYRLNYILLDRYILEFNGRYDGSSRFPERDRFGFFPSASVAWRVDRESFMAPLSDVVSQFKLRGSYGSLGNQAVSEYGYIATMEASPANYLIGGERPQQIEAPPLVSPNYTWEEVSTINFGVDLGFFDGRLNTTFDIYRRDTKGMLTQGKDLPDVLGADEPDENSADLKTNGWEFSIGYTNDVKVAGKPLTISSRFVLSDSRSYITRFDNPNRNLIQYYEGMEFGEIWGLQSDGLFANEDEIEALDQTAIIPWGALSIVPGWPSYQDLDGNGAIEKGNTVDDPKDLSIIGNVSPRLRFGFTLNMEWNGFDVSAFFQGVGKRDYYPLDYLYWGFYQQPYAGGYQHLTDFYRAEADSEVDRAKHSQAYIDAGLADQNLDAFYPQLQSWLADRNLGERIDQAQGLAIPQTRYLLDGSYLRLKNLTVGYTLPQNIVEKASLSNVRIFFSGENLAEWSALSDFFDPEAINDNVRLDPSDSPGRGIGSGFAYPVQRRYAVGLNVTF